MSPEYLALGEIENNPIVLEDLFCIANSPISWDALRNKSVLVTGGAGFLGAYITKSLLIANVVHELNLRVVCMIRSRRSAALRLPNCADLHYLEMIEHDVALPFPEKLPPCDFLIHAASQASPKYYGVDPVGTLLANTTGTYNALNHARRRHSCKFLFVSSGEVYGIPTGDGAKRVSESDSGYVDPVQVRSCYAQSKRMAETACIAWMHQYGVHACIARPFHTYGPGMDLDDGRVFADFVSDVVHRRNIRLKSDGMAMRPFCYVADTVVALLLILTSGKNGVAYNVGNPDAEISMGNLAQLIADLYPELGLQVDRATPHEPSSSYLRSPLTRCVPNVDRLVSLGWHATTDLSTGFRRTIESYRKVA